MFEREERETSIIYLNSTTHSIITTLNITTRIQVLSSSTDQNDDEDVVSHSRGFKPLSRTEIYGFGLAVHESCRLMDDHPRLLEDFLDLTLNLVAEYDREGDEVPQHLRDCAVYGLLSGEPKYRDTFR